MHVWQANLGRGTIPEFKINLTRTLEAAGDRAVIGFQEIDEADTPDELEILLRRTSNTHTCIGEKTSVPILVPKHLQIIDYRQTIACKGLAGFTPTRHVNEVILGLNRKLSVAVLDLHVPIDRPQTETRRAEAVGTLQDRAVECRHQGYAGVWMADTNTRVGWPQVVTGEKRVIDAGIDKMKAWPSPGRRVVVTGRRTVNLTIDGHNAHGARVMFEAA